MTEAFVAVAVAVNVFLLVKPAQVGWAGAAAPPSPGPGLCSGSSPAPQWPFQFQRPAPHLSAVQARPRSLCGLSLSGGHVAAPDRTAGAGGARRKWARLPVPSLLGSGKTHWESHRDSAMTFVPRPSERKTA